MRTLATWQGAYMTPELRDAVDRANRIHATDGHWCAGCQVHRTRTQTELCPVCVVTP